MLTPYLLLLALTIHAVFEGFAIGLQTDYKEVLNLLMATLCHKWAASLTLGISFTKGSIEPKHAIAMIFIFSISTPLGIGIGWILSETSEVLSGVFMAIAAGTFVYIAASEIIVEEFSVT